VSRPEGRHVLRRARTAMSLPGRIVEVEDRCVALETHVVAKLDEMRSELAEIRMLLNQRLDAEADATELVGRLLRSSEARLDALEAVAGLAPVAGGGPVARTTGAAAPDAAGAPG